MPFDYDDYDREPPDLADILFNEDSPDYDPVAFELWYDGVVKMDEDAYADLLEYMDWEYGIDFEEEFDWSMYP